jgi:hypothetical protein
VKIERSGVRIARIGTGFRVTVPGKRALLSERDAQALANFITCEIAAKRNDESDTRRRADAREDDGEQAAQRER